MLIRYIRPEYLHIIKFFLKLRHWQVFLIAFALPLAVYIATFSLSFSSENPFEVFKFLPMVVPLMLFGQYGWIFSCSRLLNRLTKEVPSLKLDRFYFFFFFPTVYILVFASLVSWFFGQLSLHMDVPPDIDIDAIFLTVVFVFPLHLFAMFCMFYCFYFVAKTIRSAELKREATLGEYIGEIMLVWFFVVGIWFLQPRVNKLLGELKETGV